MKHYKTTANAQKKLLPNKQSFFYDCFAYIDCAQCTLCGIRLCFPFTFVSMGEIEKEGDREKMLFACSRIMKAIHLRCSLFYEYLFSDMHSILI